MQKRSHKSDYIAYLCLYFRYSDRKIHLVLKIQVDSHLLLNDKCQENPVFLAYAKKKAHIFYTGCNSIAQRIWLPFIDYKNIQCV